MGVNKRRILFFGMYMILVHFWYPLGAQELPPIAQYKKEMYKASNQNWMIAQNDKGTLFFANNDGLLSFNGARWLLYPTPNHSILRSVKCVENRVYTGAYMDFGYWEPNAKGELIYQSLVQKLKLKTIEDEQFWNIIYDNHCVYFQSLNRIYIYHIDKQSIKIVTHQNKVDHSFLTRNGVWFQSNDILFSIKNGVVQKEAQLELLNKNKLVALIHEHILVTQQKGIYILKNHQVSALNPNLNQLLKENVIYSATPLSSNRIAIGTIANGVYIIDEQGNMLQHFTQTKGLSNTTVLSVYEDTGHHLWLGLDNGIDCIHLNSNISTYVDQSGEIGTVYTAIKANDLLYIGTNKGLFYREFNHKNAPFKNVSNTKGQVWDLFEYENTLFCAHTLGTFIIQKGTATQIYSESGTWKFLPYQGKLLQGNYDGISVLEKQGQTWKFAQKIQGFHNSARYLELAKAHTLIVNHEYKGLFELNFNSNLTQFTKVKKLNYPQKSKNSGLISYHQQVLYTGADGVFILDTLKNQFVKNLQLSAIFKTHPYLTGKMTADATNHLWLFTKTNINQISENINSFKISSLPITSQVINAISGFENISEVAPNQYVIGSSNGYLILNPADSLQVPTYPLEINTVKFSKFNKSPQLTDIQKNISFDYDENNIEIQFSVPNYDQYLPTYYQYQLKGFDTTWSAWQTQAQAEFKNLPSGKYIFSVKAKIGNTVLKNTAEIQFTIHKIWYKTNFAILVYLLLSVILFYILNKFYTDYHNKKHQKIIEENNLLLEFQSLENQKEIMRIQNLELSQDVELKNKELATTTLNLVNKNELLKVIKEDLSQTSQQSGMNQLKSVISIITKNVNEGDSWARFKEAFDTYDKNFIKSLMDAHPNLTSNDLKLCAYLRLNMSSKEIAPLLNISTRSVEVKRYRLRKKMGLSKNQGLNEYIFKF